MNVYIKCDAGGRILEKVRSSDPEYGLGYEKLEDQMPPGATHYRAGEFLTQPPAPSEAHDWDDEAFVWVISPAGLDRARSSARERINAARNAAERAGFPAYGKIFDSDDKAVQRVAVAAQAAVIAKAAGQPVSVAWTCADNSIITMDADMLIQMPIIMMQAADALHQRATALKAQITAAATLAEIEAVTW